MSGMKAILETVFDEATATSACPDCQADLAAFVEAELAGQPASSLYPAVAGHLATCADCAAERRDLASLLELDRQGRFEQPPRPAAFDFGYLPPRPVAAPAQPAVRPWRLEGLGRLVIQLSADLLRSLQGPGLQPAMLKGGPPAVFELELAEGLEDLRVNIRAEPQPRQPERVDLAVSVDIPSRGGWPNLAGSTVMLRRGDDVLDEQETDAFGKVVFEDVAVDDLPALAFEIAP